MANKRQTKLSKKVMESIENDEVQMYSKTYFQVLNLALVAASGLFVLLTSIILIVVIRDINYGHSLGFREYGSRGHGEFIQALPWLALLFGLLSFLITMTLIKKFNFTYKHRLITIIGALLFAIAGLSLIYAGTGVDEAISKTTPFNGLHSFGKYAEKNTVSGEVIDVENEKIIILSNEGKKVEIIIDDKFTGLTKNLKLGDKIFVVGEYEGEYFEAFGIKRGDKPAPPHKNRSL